MGVKCSRCRVGWGVVRVWRGGGESMGIRFHTYLLDAPGQTCIRRCRLGSLPLSLEHVRSPARALAPVLFRMPTTSSGVSPLPRDRYKCILTRDFRFSYICTLAYFLVLCRLDVFTIRRAAAPLRDLRCLQRTGVFCRVVPPRYMHSPSTGLRGPKASAS